MTYSSGDLDTLARTVFGEARGESVEGQYAVAHVILNRVKRGSRFGYTISDVCRRPLQFSTWNPNDPNYPTILSANIQQPTFLRCFGVACLALSGTVPDPTQGSDHYFTLAPPPGVDMWPPSWAKAMEHKTNIGAHSFYKEVV